MTLNYSKHTRISLKTHPQFTEKWLQDRIEEDPTILGLGDVEVKDVERIHPKAGRLDLLLRDPDSGKRYEVELMVGEVDASHIIRTIEYWDIERKRYPQYDHCAVIVAEDITSRFLNVISLFNNAIPMIALQLQAVQIGDHVSLIFTKVLDELVLGEDDEDEVEKPTDRAYWENRGSPTSLAILDDCFEVLKEIDPAVQPKYNKYYIGISQNGLANNFVLFRPKKTHLNIGAAVPDKAAWKEKIEDTGFVFLAGKSKRLRFTTTAKELGENRELVKSLFEACHAGQSD